MDLQLQREQEIEAKRAQQKYDRKKWNRHNKEVDEELMPRATGLSYYFL